MFDEHRLREKSTLAEYDMQDGDVVYVIVEQCGGMFHQTSSRDGAYDDPKQSWEVRVLLPSGQEVKVPAKRGESSKELKKRIMALLTV